MKQWLLSFSHERAELVLPMLTAYGDVIAHEVVEQDMERASRRIEEAINDPSGRLRVYLNNMSFPAVDHDIERVRLLQQLHCNHNRLLTTLPSSIGRLAHLRVINLSNCAIHRLPEELSDLRCLEEVDVSHNLLPKFVYDVSGWTQSLRRLNLSHNPIAYFSPSCVELFLSLRHKQSQCERVQLHTEESLVIWPNTAMFKPSMTSHMSSSKEEQRLLGSMLPDHIETCFVCETVVMVGKPTVYVHFWVWPGSNPTHVMSDETASALSSLPVSKVVSVESRALDGAAGIAPSRLTPHRHCGDQGRIPLLYPLCHNVECQMQLSKSLAIKDLKNQS